ncbi:MAG: hypothetical protein C4289_07105 [Chloroflexota bacterium]
MSASEYTALLRYLVEAVWHRGDLSVLDRFVADDVVVHSYAAAPMVARQRSRDERQMGCRRALEEISGEDDRVIVRYRAYRMSDPAPGAAPASPEPVYSGTNIYRFTGGRIAEIWVFHEGGSQNRERVQPAHDAADDTTDVHSLDEPGPAAVAKQFAAAESVTAPSAAL